MGYHQGGHRLNGPISGVVLYCNEEMKFFAVKGVSHCHRLHKEDADAPTLAMFTAKLGKGLEQPSLVGGVPRARRFGLDGL